MYRSLILVLFEPRISGTVVDRVCSKLGMSSWGRSKAAGFSGGIWVLWNDGEVNLECKHVHRFFIHMVVAHHAGRQWELTAVYGSPDASRCRLLWSHMDQIIVEQPWLLMRDFNRVLKLEERSSASNVSRNFAEWVARHGLIDLGFSGPIFTWAHGVTPASRQAARLDRDLCDEEWRMLFQSAHVVHLPHSHSDHSPLLLNLTGDEGRRLGDRPFHFLSA